VPETTQCPRAREAVQQLPDDRTFTPDDVEHHMEAAAFGPFPFGHRTIQGERTVQVMAGEVDAEESLQLLHRVSGRLPR
jgi:hypothetical protein